MKNYTPEIITELKPNQIFVFGSNEGGEHFGGAAKTAHKHFGAIWGVGEGITGQCYAFPTLHKASTLTGKGNLQILTDSKLQQSFKMFFETVEENPDKEFLLTKIGTGIAGIPIETMRKLFNLFYNEQNHKNLIFPIEFELIKL